MSAWVDTSDLTRCIAELRSAAVNLRTQSRVVGALFGALAGGLALLPNVPLLEAVATLDGGTHAVVLVLLGCAAGGTLAWQLCGHLDNLSYETIRLHVLWGLTDGRLLATALDEYGYDLLPRLGRHTGRGAWLRNMLYFRQSVALSARVHQLQRTYDGCCSDLKLRAWPATPASSVTGVALVYFLLAAVFLAVSHRRRHGFYEWALPIYQELGANPLLWKPVLGLMMLASMLLFWYGDLKGAALRTALVEALEGLREELSRAPAPDIHDQSLSRDAAGWG
jgi:hypothetical protein